MTRTERPHRARFTHPNDEKYSDLVCTTFDRPIQKLMAICLQLMNDAATSSSVGVGVWAVPVLGLMPRGRIAGPHRN